MAGPSRPSFPSEPSLRRLGVGGGGGERPLRAQLIVALVVGLVLLAVPLYLWRRPSGTENAPKDGGAPADAHADAPDAAAAAVMDASAADERVKLGTVQRVKCGASSRSSGQEGNLCDRLPFFEDALAKSIRDNVDCAPKLKKEGTINFVLTVDFTARRVHVFPGASGAWKGPAARKATQCASKALPAPDWDAISHQYKYYSIAILATYPLPKPPAAAGSAAPAGSGAPPLFE
jgi:hypothetical protein